MMIQVGDKVTKGNGRTVWTVTQVYPFGPAREIARIETDKITTHCDTYRLTLNKPGMKPARIER